MESEQDLADAIVDGSLDLVCPNMTLVRCPSYSDVVASGTGVIRSNSKEQLSLKLVGSLSDWPRVLAQKVRPGTMMTADDFLMMKAVDERGREWNSNWIAAVQVMPWLSSRSVVLRQTLDYISTRAQRDHSEQSNIGIYWRSLPVPLTIATKTVQTVGSEEVFKSWTLDRHTQEVDGALLAVKTVDRWTRISASRKVLFGPSWAGALCQAIQFCMPDSAGPTIVTRAEHDFEDTCLYSGPFTRYAIPLPPPLRVGSSDTAKEFWALVEKFVQFAEADSVVPELVISELEGIRRGSRGSFQTACLLLAVGVEALARSILNEHVPTVDPAKLEDLSNHIAQWNGDETIKKRAAGAIKNMLNRSAADQLYAWADRCGTSVDLLQAWKRLRHPKAHGNQLIEDDALAADYYATAELMNRLVAHAVGYTGSVLPTSQPGWGESISASDEDDK